jgi:hypothetical protein
MFEEGTKRKAIVPSPSQYKMQPVNDWNGRSLNRSPSNLSKAARITEIDRLFAYSKLPEKSTLGPQNYKFNHNYNRPREAMNGYATLMQ